MEILHVSAECYPVAKAGGLGDVVGALPRYQREAGHVSKVVMPMYRTRFLYDSEWEVVHKGGGNLGYRWFDYTVIKEKGNRLGFDLYLVDIHGLLDREKVYGYDDDDERFIAFQVAVTDWLSRWQHRPDIVHVHDHHTALIPFMMEHCHAYRALKGIPTVLTIHNAQYQGVMGWDKSMLIPSWDSWKRGLLEWSGNINPLACGIKCAHRVTTVSTSYLREMRESSNGLEDLFEYERGKCSGILNGIDTATWDPGSDRYLEHHYSAADVKAGKADNKRSLCQTFHIDPYKPLFVFIGRLVDEKAADLLPQVVGDSFHYIGRRMSFLILGSGDPATENRLETMKEAGQGDYGVYVGYNEALAHRMYAAADFLLMPSRVEPCGLNQMYAMRYGTVPIVRRTGGLQDTGVDLGEPGGYGFTHVNASVGDITHAVYRALQLFRDTDRLQEVRKAMMELDFGWQRSAGHYTELYRTLL
jgi:starch synthase